MVADRLAPRELLGELPARRRADRRRQAARAAGRPQQEEINRVIVERALAGKRVVRFKGGDNFVFGRGYEEVLACREAGVPVTVIPGLSSPLAVPARRRHPGHPPRRRPRVHGDLRPPAARAPRVAGRLGRGGRPARHRRADDGGARTPPRSPTALVAGGRDRGHPGRRGRATARCRRSGRCCPRWATLGRGPRGPASVRPPAIIVVGEVVRGGASASTSALMADPASRSPTPPTRGSPTTATCATSQLRKHLEAEHGLFLAEGEKVVRRAVEAGFTAAVVPDGAALARRAGRRARHHATRPATWSREALAEEVTGFHVHRGALASLERRPLPAGRRGARRRPVGAGARGHRRPHQRRRDLPLRRRARLRRGAAGAAVRRPALPALGQGGAWARCSRCRGPGSPTGTTRCRTLSAAGLHHRRAHPRRRRRRRSRRRSPGWTGWRWCSAPRGTGSRRAGSGPPTGGRSSRCATGIDSLNVAAATAVACYVTARR